MPKRIIVTDSKLETTVQMGATSIIVGREGIRIPNGTDPVELIGEIGALAFCKRNPQRHESAYNLDLETGWTSDPYYAECAETLVVGQETITFRPGKKLSKAIAAAGGVLMGWLTPDQFFQFTKNLLTRKQAEGLLDTALTGRSSSFPFVVRIKVGQETATMKGELGLHRVFSMSDRFALNAPDDAEKRRSQVIKETCLGTPKNETDRKFCEYARGHTRDGSLEYLKYRWKDLKEADVAKLSKSRTERGETLLMKFLAGNCVAPEKKGASGFSSGMDTEREQKKQLFQWILKYSDLDALDVAGRNALHYAAYWGCSEEFSILRKKGIKILPQDFAGNPFALYAIYGDDPKVIDTAFAMLKPQDFDKRDENYYRAGGVSTHEGLVPVFSNMSLLSAAVGLNNPDLLERVLKWKQFIPAESLQSVIQGVLYSYDPKLLDVFVKSGVNFWKEGREDQHLGLAFLHAQKHEKDPKRREFLEYAGRVFAEDKKEIRAGCERDSVPDHCYARWGYCEDVRDLSRRDSCFSQNGNCEKVVEPQKRWSCYGLRGGGESKICETAASVTEQALCHLAVHGKELSWKDRARYLQLAAQSKEGFKGLKEIGYVAGPRHLSNNPAQRDKDPTVEEQRQAYHACISQSGARQTVDPEDGYAICSRLAIPNGIPPEEHYKNELESCRTKGDWDSCSFVYFLAGKAAVDANRREAIKSKTREISLRTCEAGDPRACVTHIRFSQDKASESDKARWNALVCDKLNSVQACGQIADNLDKTDPAKADLMRIQMIPDADHNTIVRLIWRFESKKLDLKAIRPQLPELEKICGKTSVACGFAYDLYSEFKDEKGKSRMAQGALVHAKKSCEEGKCIDAGALARKIPEVKAYLTGICEKGAVNACLQVSGGDGNFIPALNLDAVLKECNGAPTRSLAHSCYSKYLELAAKSPNNTSLVIPICEYVDASYQCERARTYLLQRIPFDKSVAAELRSACKAKKVGACATLGQYYANFDPENGFRYYEEACELSGSTGRSCTRATQILVKQKKTRELNRFFEKICLQGSSQVCMYKEYFLMLAGGSSKPLTEIEARCKNGDVLACARLRDYYRETKNTKAIAELRTELCKKHNWACDPNWEWQAWMAE